MCKKSFWKKVVQYLKCDTIAHRTFLLKKFDFKETAVQNSLTMYVVLCPLLWESTSKLEVYFSNEQMFNCKMSSKIHGNST